MSKPKQGSKKEGTPSSELDPLKYIYALVLRKGGLFGLLLFLFIIAGGFVWFNWDTVKSLPGISWAREKTSCMRHLETDNNPDGLMVLVANLNRDEDGKLRDQLSSALAGFPGIEVQGFNCTLPSETGAGERARAYLQKSGASVLVWGRVIKPENANMSLLITTASTSSPIAQYQLDDIDGQRIDLSGELWRDLLKAIFSVIVSRDDDSVAGVSNERLKSFIVGVGQLLDDNHPDTDSKWSKGVRASINIIHGDALYMLGEKEGSEKSFKEAVQAYSYAREEAIPCEGLTLARCATTQELLDKTFQKLCGSKEGLASPEATIAKCQEVLDFFIQEEDREAIRNTREYIDKL